MQDNQISKIPCPMQRAREKAIELNPRVELNS